MGFGFVLGDSGENVRNCDCSRLDAVRKQRSFHDWVSSKSYLGGKTREVSGVIGKEEESFILTRLENVWSFLWLDSVPVFVFRFETSECSCFLCSMIHHNCSGLV